MRRKQVAKYKSKKELMQRRADYIAKKNEIAKELNQVRSILERDLE